MNEEQRPLISIIIPVFNESQTVAAVIKRINDLQVSKEIIVVDDGSTDGSKEIIAAMEKQYTFSLITNTSNQGKGASVLAAVKLATGKYLVVEDSDMELNPQDIFKMLEMIRAENTDLVNGNRKVTGTKNTNFISLLAKKITKIILWLLYGKNINDLLCSYKLCTLKNFKILDLQSPRFGLETEWIVKALKKKWIIKEVYIDYHPRKIKEGKKITAKDGFEIIWNIIRYRFL